MKKLFLVLLCVAGVSISYADGGLFGLIGSALNVATGNSNQSKIDSSSLVTSIEQGKNGWKIYTYDYKIKNIEQCENRDINN